MQQFVRDHVEGVLYVVAAITYIAFGLWQKWALNWLVGPLWLLLWLWWIPAAWRRIRGEPGLDERELGSRS